MEAPGRVREPRANLILSCRRTSIMNPPVGGTFWFQIFIQAPSPEIWSETISGAEGGSGAVSGVACFGLPPSEKIYRQRRGRVNGQSRHGRIWQFMRHTVRLWLPHESPLIGVPSRRDTEQLHGSWRT